MDINRNLSAGNSEEKRYSNGLRNTFLIYSFVVVAIFTVILNNSMLGCGLFIIEVIILWQIVTTATGAVLTQEGITVEQFLFRKRFIEWDDIIDVEPRFDLLRTPSIRIRSSKYSFSIKFEESDSSEILDFVIENAGLVPASESKLDHRYTKSKL